MKCETTSSVKECALRARSGDVHVARVVVSLVVDAAVGLTLGLIAHVVIVVFVVAILHRIFSIWRYTLYTNESGSEAVWQAFKFLWRQTRMAALRVGIS